MFLFYSLFSRNAVLARSVPARPRRPLPVARGHPGPAVGAVARARTRQGPHGGSGQALGLVPGEPHLQVAVVLGRGHEAGAGGGHARLLQAVRGPAAAADVSALAPVRPDDDDDDGGDGDESTRYVLVLPLTLRYIRRKWQNYERRRDPFFSFFITKIWIDNLYFQHRNMFFLPLFRSKSFCLLSSLVPFLSSPFPLLSNALDFGLRGGAGSEASAAEWRERS